MMSVDSFVVGCRELGGLSNLDDGRYVLRIWLDDGCNGFEYMIRVKGGVDSWLSGYDSNMDMDMDMEGYRGSMEGYVDNLNDGNKGFDYSLFYYDKD